MPAHKKFFTLHNGKIEATHINDIKNLKRSTSLPKPEKGLYHISRRTNDVKPEKVEKIVGPKKQPQLWHYEKGMYPKQDILEQQKQMKLYSIRPPIPGEKRSVSMVNLVEKPKVMKLYAIDKAPPRSIVDEYVEPEPFVIKEKTKTIPKQRKKTPSPEPIKEKSKPIPKRRRTPSPVPIKKEPLRKIKTPPLREPTPPRIRTPVLRTFTPTTTTRRFTPPPYRPIVKHTVPQLILPPIVPKNAGKSIYTVDSISKSMKYYRF